MIIRIATAALAMAHALQSGKAPPPVVVDPVMTPPAIPALAKRLITFEPGAIDCDGTAVGPVRSEQPVPLARYEWQPLGVQTDQLSFSIDVTGRPVDIRQSDDAPGWLKMTDVEPAFAVWRFSEGTPRQRCRITFALHDQPIAEAPIAEIRRYAALARDSSPLGHDLFLLVQPARSDCFAPGLPTEVFLASPDFDEVPQAPGTRHYTMVGFDIDASGVPAKIHVASSDGDIALDEAATDAMRRSRFVKQARQGCLMPYWRSPTTPIAAPTAPDEDALKAKDSRCDGAKGDWASMPEHVYPPAFQKRSIEGWAIVRYDVAPWGETGNVAILASEPADVFGDVAANIVRQSRKRPSKLGLSGCVGTIRFEMGPVDPPKVIEKD